MEANENKFLNILINNSTLFFLIILVVFFCFVNPMFFSINNLQNILDIVAVLILTSIVMSFILELGSIDLSVEGIIALTSIITAFFVKNMMTSYDLGVGAIFIAILVGAFFGFLNGFIHTRLKIPSFMVTLGMNFITLGIGLVISKGQYIIIKDDFVRSIVMKKIGIIQIPLIIAALLTLIMWYVTKYTKFARYVLAIGGNEKLASELGVDTDKIKLLVFTLAGAVYGLVGAILSLKLGAGDNLISYGYTFETISACVVGGIAITGGVGNISKAIVGAFIITVLRTGMIFMKVPPEIQSGVMGFIIIFSVILTIDRSKLSIVK